MEARPYSASGRRRQRPRARLLGSGQGGELDRGGHLRPDRHRTCGGDLSEPQSNAGARARRSRLRGPARPDSRRSAAGKDLVRGDRNRRDQQDEVVQKLIEEGRPVAEPGRMMGWSRATTYRVLDCSSTRRPRCSALPRFPGASTPARGTAGTGRCGPPKGRGLSLIHQARRPPPTRRIGLARKWSPPDRTAQRREAPGPGSHESGGWDAATRTGARMTNPWRSADRLRS